MARCTRRTVAAVIVALVGAATSGCGASGTSTTPPASPSATAQAPTGSASPGTSIYTLEHPEHRNPAGLVWDQASRSFFVGAFHDGTIYQGRLDDPAVRVVIDGAPGRTATGMKIAHGRLYVAGGIYGTVAVYDLATRALLGTFTTGQQENILDLVVTEAGDLWATDAARPVLWHLGPEQVAAGSGAATALPVDPEVHYGSDQHDLGGIVALTDQQLVVVDYSDGTLYRVDLDAGAARGRTITPIDGAKVPRGGGMIAEEHRLVVADDAGLSVVDLSDDARTATISGQVRDPSFRHTFAVARADDRYLVLNTAFTQPGPYTVTSVPATT